MQSLNGNQQISGLKSLTVFQSFLSQVPRTWLFCGPELINQQLYSVDLSNYKQENSLSGCFRFSDSGCLQWSTYFSKKLFWKFYTFCLFCSMLWVSNISDCFTWFTFMQSYFKIIPFQSYHIIIFNDRKTSYDQISVLLCEAFHSGCQFHQRFTCSFYARRSRERKKDWQLDCLFLTLLGSACVKAVHRMLMKLSPGAKPKSWYSTKEILLEK